MHGLIERKSLVGILILICVGCGTSDQDPPLSSPLALQVSLATLSSDLGRFIPDELKQTGVPGLSVAVVRDGQVIWAEGFGVANVLTREPIRADTVFEVASISKAITAYTALCLVGQGKFTLDAALHRYLATPFLPESAQREAITLKHLLTHTSGLSNLLVGVYPDTKIWFPPGDHFSYSGHGFQYLGAAIESITGMPFDRYVQTTVLDKLQMDASGYRLAADRWAWQANPHFSMVSLLTGFIMLWVPIYCIAGSIWWLVRRCRRPRPPFNRSAMRILLALSLAGASVAFVGLAQSVVVLLPIGLFLLLLLLARWLSLRLLHDLRESRGQMLRRVRWMRMGLLFGVIALLWLIAARPAVPLPVRGTDGMTAAWGLRSTAPDLARFIIELMDPQNIDRALIQQMLQPQVRVSEHVSWGLGIGLQHSQLGDSFWHWGSNPGYESLIIGYPAQKLGIVILTNGGSAGAGLALARQVAHRAIGGEHYSYWNEVPGLFWPSSAPHH